MDVRGRSDPSRSSSSLRRRLHTIALALAVGCGALGSCTTREAASDRPDAAPGPTGPAAAFLDTLAHRTFDFFWELADPRTGLAPDRAPSESFASIAATGFALTAYPIGVVRGYVERTAAAARTLATLRFLWTAPQHAGEHGSIGHRGFFYHFVDGRTGARFESVELSTMDTALLLAGALFCQSWFDGGDAVEREIRALADSLYLRVDWQWASVRPPTIGHGWKPESGFLPYDWRGYNEAMLLYLLALGSPSHPVAPAAWEAWTSGYRWGGRDGQEHVGFAPLFGHQYTQVWIDLRGIQDATMREHGIDYFENSRRAVLAQHAYAVTAATRWRGYGPHLWGLTACDGPVHGTFEVNGKPRQFHTYWARGASFTEVHDDGTVAPTAAGGSIAFAPEIVIPTLLAMRATHGERIFSTYGFLDALNPTFRFDVPVQHGYVVPGEGWYDDDYLGIDQGPILAMLENHQSALVWLTMRRNPHVVRGLRAAGFGGGWLDSLAVRQ
jgi:hypothetical protein